MLIIARQIDVAKTNPDFFLVISNALDATKAIDLPHLSDELLP
jgi:hypothetical protein